MTGPAATVPGTVRRARDRVESATRAARLARIAAGPELRGRARRRSRWLRRTLAGAAVLAVPLLAATVILRVLDSRAGELDQARRDVVAAARSAAVVMLTADPAQPDAYVDRVLDVSTGAQRDRLSQNREVLRDTIAAQPEATTGRVIAAGLVADPTGPGDGSGAGSSAQVLLVADAANPELLGAGPGEQRVTVTLTMIRAGERWKIDRAVRS